MIKFPLFVARRYFFSKKTRNAINVISSISVGGVTIGTMALIVVLSVFNGFDGLVKSLFNSFDPDIKITAKTGKTFIPDSTKIAKISDIEGVEALSTTLEENALLQYGSRQYIGTVKGVDSNFVHTSGMDTMIVDGTFSLKKDGANLAVVGYGVAYFLSVSIKFNETLEVYLPNRKKKPGVDPRNAFKQKTLYPAGIFSIQQEFDEQYVIVPMRFMRKLLDYPKAVSAIEIKLSAALGESKKDDIKQQIQALAGENLSVLNRYQQHALLYKIMQSEKWAIFLILSFILIIASFNVIGSLTMLIIDKQADIATLQSLGASEKLIRRIFLFEGWLISLIGAVLGLILGFVLCMVQIVFEVIPFPGRGFIITAYPIEMQSADFMAVFFTVLLIGFLAAWYPVKRITKKYMIEK